MDTNRVYTIQVSEKEHLWQYIVTFESQNCGVKLHLIYDHKPSLILAWDGFHRSCRAYAFSMIDCVTSAIAFQYERACVEYAGQDIKHVHLQHERPCTTMCVHTQFVYT